MKPNQAVLYITNVAEILGKAYPAIQSMKNRGQLPHKMSNFLLDLEYFIAQNSTISTSNHKGNPTMSMLESALNYAKENRGKLPTIAEQTGLGYQWLMKFTNGKISDPGVKKIEVLLKHKTESEGTSSKPQ